MENRIHLLRTSLRLSQEQFGEKIGVTKTTISLLENDKKTLSKQTRLAILREFNVNPEWLDEGKGNMFNTFTSQSDLVEFMTSVLQSDEKDAKRKILIAISKLEPKHWEELADLLDTIKKQ